MRLILTRTDAMSSGGSPDATRRFDRAGGRIGRAPDNDWVLADPQGQLADHHCRIAFGDTGYVLTDTSAAGVFINESPRPVGAGNSVALAPGDRIALGAYRLAVGLDAPPAAAPDDDAVLMAKLRKLTDAVPAPDDPRLRERRAETRLRARIAEIETRRSGAATARPRWLRRTIGALAAACAGIALLATAAAGYRWLASDDEAARPPPPAPAVQALAPAPPPALVQPPPLDRARLQADLARLFGGFACANLEAEIADGGSVTVTGFVARSDELARLQREAAALPQVPRLDNRATIEPWPSCAVTRLLRTYAADGPSAPLLEPNHPDLVYREGDIFRVTATARAASDSYLYIDYFDTGGRVVHLLPTRWRADNRLAPGQPVMLGAEPAKARRNERFYRVAAPFGTSLLVALSSPRPLFVTPRPEQEDAHAYLIALGEALAPQPGDGDSPIAASRQAITLAPAGPADRPLRKSRPARATSQPW
jgi:type VI secretion system FHA domain protein